MKELNQEPVLENLDMIPETDCDVKVAQVRALLNHIHMIHETELIGRRNYF